MTTTKTAVQRDRARVILAWCGISVGADFHALDRSQVDDLLIQAGNERYRKPANANGSRARYFHDMLQRRAQRIVKSEGATS